MKQYKLTEGGAYHIDNVYIPVDLGNSDYVRMLQERDAGLAEILPYVAPAVPAPLTDEQEIAQWMAGNKWVNALVKGINRATDDPKHIPLGKGLTDPELIQKIKVNKE